MRKRPLRLAKGVSNLELLYDLIFVYGISVVTSLCHQIEGGFLDWGTWLIYLFSFLVILQIWFSTTLLMNRYGDRSMPECVGLFVNMFLLYFLANGVRTDWHETSLMFNLTWAGILANLAAQWLWFYAPFIRTAENQTAAGGKSYAYYLTVRSGHGSELTTVLDHPEMNDPAIDETFSKTMRKMWVQFAKTGNPSLSADISHDGKAHEWPLYDLEDKQVMVFDEFDIHPEKESERKIVDWDRTYFLTKYYCI